MGVRKKASRHMCATVTGAAGTVAKAPPIKLRKGFRLGGPRKRGRSVGISMIELVSGVATWSVVFSPQTLFLLAGSVVLVLSAWPLRASQMTRMNDL